MFETTYIEIQLVQYIEPTEIINFRVKHDLLQSLGHKGVIVINNTTLYLLLRAC